jgi:hypothetical protein
MKLPYLAVATIGIGLGAASAFANDNGRSPSGLGASEYSPGDRMKDSSTYLRRIEAQNETKASLFFDRFEIFLNLIDIFLKRLVFLDQFEVTGA